MPSTTITAAAPLIHWEEAGTAHSALWRSDSGWAPPKHVVIADDTLTADAAYRLASSGTGMLWRGDFHNARQLLSALARRVERGQRTRDRDLTAAFRRHRTDAVRRAHLLGLVLIPLDPDLSIPLRRAPNVRQACLEVYGPKAPASVVALREVMGVIGAHEWRTKGVEIEALGARIHPHYGVFSPVRGEYLELVATAPLPGTRLAFDIGVGTGVLSAILANRGVARVVATDQDPRALICARENISTLGFSSRVDVVGADLFPAGRAELVVCNPPWIPAAATTSTDFAVYDPDSRMLRGFLSGLAEHLEPKGEGWLILSDIAERLGLRSRSQLLDLIDDAGLDVIARLDTRPKHPRALDASDPLHAARAAEVTSLWRLKIAN